MQTHDKDLNGLSDEKLLYMFAISNQHCAYIERDKCFVDKKEYQNSFKEREALEQECLKRMRREEK